MRFNLPTINQVAFVSNDAIALRKWYSTIFSLPMAHRIICSGKMATRVQGVAPDFNFCHWLIDNQGLFQFEFFKFLKPDSKPRPDNWRICDHGFGLTGLYCEEFDQVIERLNTWRAGSASVMGSLGNRRIYVQDPDDNWVEVYEKDPLAQYVIDGKVKVANPEIPTACRLSRFSVPDLDIATEMFIKTFDLERMDEAIHDATHEQYWGLPDAISRSVVLRGGGVLLELVQYETPIPVKRPDDRTVADIGLMNAAIGFDSSAQFDHYFKRSVENGFIPNGKPIDPGIFKVMYSHCFHREFFEMLYPKPWAYRLTGFIASGAYATTEIEINKVSLEQVWAKVTNHETIGSWAFFSSKLIKAGEQDKNGIGAIRRIAIMGIPFSEKVITYKENRRYGYVMNHNLLIRGHRGEMVIEPTANGVKIIWLMSFKSPLPGLGIISATIVKFLCRGSLKRLKRQLEALN